MRNLLFGVILGLLAVVHSTPVENVTHFPAKPDDDVLKEVLEDGYLVHATTHRVLTTNPPRSHETIQVPQQPTSEPADPEMEGSADAEPPTTPTVKDRGTDTMNATESENPTSASGTLPQGTGSSSSASVTTQNPQPNFLSSSVPPRAPPTPAVTNQTSDIEESSGDLMGNGTFGSGFGSGSGDMQDFVPIARDTSGSDTNESTSSSSSFPVGEGLETESGKESESDKASDKESDKESDKASDKESNDASDEELRTRSGSNKSRMFGTSVTEMATQQRGHVDKVVLNKQTPEADTQHRTPGWIIIVAFIVGLAALVMLCVAIATRDKWNGPHKASQLASKSSSSDQQREQEMTFMHKESPRENGKAAEYTVIPLDELPEDYSSH